MVKFINNHLCLLNVYKTFLLGIVFTMMKVRLSPF